MELAAFEQRMEARRQREEAEEAKKAAEPVAPPPPAARASDIEKLDVVYTRSKAANVGYVKIADEKIWKSVKSGPGVILDLDFQGQVIGIELLNLTWV